MYCILQHLWALVAIISSALNFHISVMKPRLVLIRPKVDCKMKKIMLSLSLAPGGYFGIWTVLKETSRPKALPTKINCKFGSQHVITQFVSGLIILYLNNASNQNLPARLGLFPGVLQRNGFHSDRFWRCMLNRRIWWPSVMGRRIWWPSILRHIWWVGVSRVLGRWIWYVFGLERSLQRGLGWSRPL